jgi:hypothetical protein
MKTVNAINVKQYKELPKSEREIFGFWYRLPKLYEWGGERFEDYWKKHYPIQFRIREGIENLLISISVFKDKLIDNTWTRIFPKNAWARKTIPHTYSDKPELIQDFLFASIIDFVDNEPTEYTDWESSKEHKQTWETINKLYKFSKHTLPARRKRLDEMMSELYDEKSLMEFVDKSDDPRYEEMSALEKQTESEIQQNLLEIVKIRQYLWT